MILIDPSIDYEITFWVKGDSPLTFGVVGYNVDLNRIDLKDITTLFDNNFFFQVFELPITDRYYFIRGILYNFNKSQLSVDDGKMESGFGNNLKLIEDIKYITPCVVLSNNTGSASGELYLYDFKVRPLSFEKEVCGFLGIKNLIYSWLKNNSNNYSNDQITDIMKKKLLPYDQTIINQFL